MDKSLSSRYGVCASLFTDDFLLIAISRQRLQQYFFKPYKGMLLEFPQMAAQAPFQ